MADISVVPHIPHENNVIVVENSCNSDDDHRKCLLGLCRICSKVIKVKDRSFETLKHVKDLSDTFGIDYTRDKIDIHPPKFCFTCYGGLNNFKKRGTVPTYQVTTWLPHSKENCPTGLLRGNKGKGGRPARKGDSSSFGRPKNIVDINDVMKLDKDSVISPALRKAACHIVALSAKKSPGEMVQLKTGGPNPICLMPVTVARKESQAASKRTVRARTQQLNKITNIVAGGSEGVVTQRAHMIKSLKEIEREEILKCFNTTVTLPAEVVASMKATLGLPWNVLRNMRRWLKTFKVSLCAEGKMRDVVKDWVGTALKAEELPANVIKNKKVTIKLKPWCYLFNLVGYVLHFLDNLAKHNYLIDVPFIPKDQIYLKIGGDHGGGSFKMCFQIANVENPNKPDNTIIFSILEAKDHKANLTLCLERYKMQVAMFRRVEWSEKKFTVFLFGDYEFLCTMYGLSGASGRHPCLWCHVTKDMMRVPLEDQVAEPRSLETLKRDFLLFTETYHSNLAKVKFVNNVIGDVYFDIPLENVCVPGLHITLGIYLKMLGLLQDFAKQLDIKIAEYLAKEKGMIDSDGLLELVKNLNIIVEGEKIICELEERRELLMEELSWFAVNQDETFDEDLHQNLLEEIDGEIANRSKSVADARALTKQFNSGPCFSSIDVTLEKMGIEMAKYFGGTLVGNDCHKLLQPNNIITLCDSIVHVLDENIINEDLHLSTVNKMEQFKNLFSKYADCHNVFNSSTHLLPDEITELDLNIKGFMQYLRCAFPEVSISPKLHMLECHMMPFIRKWEAGCGFFGEQGGESIHSKVNNLKRTNANIQNKMERLRSVMQCHLSSTNPNALAERVLVQPRNLKRKKTS